MTDTKAPNDQPKAMPAAATNKSVPLLAQRSMLFRATRATLAATGTLTIARKMLRLFRPPPIADVSPLPPNIAVVPIPEVIPEPVKTPANRAPPANSNYDSRIAAEIANFEHDEVVHNLPEIFHYWSNKYLLPMIQPFGFIHPDDFFIKQLANAMPSSANAHAHFISIGAGNCDTEVRVAQGLIAMGITNFTIECIELNPAMLARGRALATDTGLHAHVLPVQGDFNKWEPTKPYNAVMANQSLHHVLELEHLFNAILTAIKTSNGVLITSDMIGRNGHMRWPEALAIVEEYWLTLDDKYKNNRQLKRVENKFVNWDCSTEGFEGIRAQDILPLLNQQFHFDLFIPFSNVIAPFVDRSFGPNFDLNSADDRAFIDAVHARDELEIAAGRIKPTQMFAVLSADFSRPSLHRTHLTPAFCERATNI
jgi:SAM-dependent methyltransferase